MTDDFISEEDKALFRESMRSVKPLADKNKHIKTPTTKSVLYTSKKAEPEIQKNKATLNEYYLSDAIIETVLSETILSYSDSSIPNQRFKELKKGHVPWEARLDLHGLRSEDAGEILNQFIQVHAQNKSRCLLIIHGKGGHLGAPPIIKNLLNRWLPQFPEVLAFHSALPKDGGAGAVYVLLKRKR